MAARGMGFTNWIGDEPRESPPQVAARLLGGEGAATLKVGDDATAAMGVLHRWGTGGDVLLVAAQPPQNIDGDAAAPATVTIDEFAPLSVVKAHTAGVVATGVVRHSLLGEGIAEAWPGAAVCVFTPHAVEVHTTHGHARLTPSAVASAAVDRIACARFDVVDCLMADCGDELTCLARHALAAAGADVDAAAPHRALPLAVDAHGVTLLCLTACGPQQVRACFACTVTHPAQVPDAVRRTAAAAAA